MAMNTKMAGAAMVALGIVGSVVIGAKAGQEDREDRRPHHQCNQATLRGAYGFQFGGTRPVPPSGALGVESFSAIAIRTYDGHGSFTQVSNLKGAVSGVTQDAATSGTYDVNEDCAGSAATQTPAGLSVDRFVIMDNGDLVRNVVMSPPAVFVTGIAQKIHAK
jgi:hypothetical protein